MKKYLTEKFTSKLVEILAVSLVIFIGYIVFLNNLNGFSYFNDHDIHRGFQRAVDVLNNVNPYLDFNPNDMLVQEKVPGFLPMYFFLMSVIAKISNYSFVLYLDNLRYFVFVAYISCSLMIYKLLRGQSKQLALFAMIVYMFNRWTLNDVLFLKQDTYVSLLVLISLANLKTHKRWSFLLFGLATSIKHISILISPIYLFELIILCKEYKKNFRDIVVLFFLVSAPIVIPSIPFLILEPRNFIYAIMYQLTRVPQVSGLDLKTGFDKLLVLYNQDKNNTPFFYMLPRLPMFLAMIMAMILYMREKINVWKYAAFVYLIFVAFNPVLFLQYYTWLITFMPLSLIKDTKTVSV